MVILAGCSGPPSSVHRADAGSTFTWTIDETALDQAILDLWISQDGTQAIAVGGAGDGLLLERTGNAWNAATLPDDTGVLWWAWSDGSAAAWAVGARATILRRVGNVWHREPLDTGQVDPRVAFYGVWGTGPGDVWVVGGSSMPGVPAGAILHFDGFTWSPVPEPVDPPTELFKVWGADNGDVWAVGVGGTIFEWVPADAPGATGMWTKVDAGTTATLISVYGRAANDVYAVGGDGFGVIVHWDGVAWSRFAPDSSIDPLSGVWTAPGRALYAAGNRGLLLRFGGADDAAPDAAKVDMAFPLDTVDFHALAGTQTAVHAVGADLLGAGMDTWNGTIASHGMSLGGTVTIPPHADAGPRADAAPLPDGGPMNGEICAGNLATGFYCAAGFECWQLIPSETNICTMQCASATECTAYGPNACCTRPGFQTLTTVCIPQGYPQCP